MNRTKPLWRKVNTRTHGVVHGGGKARWDRTTKAAQCNDGMRGSMHAGRRHGRDYTPLFRFLQARVGRAWAAVHAEALARLDDPDPIFWLVALHADAGEPVVRYGESSYFRGLYVDAAGNLSFVAPTLTAADLWPLCSCCTHTLDGERFVQPFDPARAHLPWPDKGSG
ncbi:MAG: hypothetical protein AAFR46_07025 [Pseudomonadota bacterium]